MCSTFGVNKITITEYYLQTNDHTERFNTSIISRWRHYVSEHQMYWYTYLFPLTYAYTLNI